MRHRLAPWIVGLVGLAPLLLAPPARSDGLTDPPDKGGTRPEAISLPSGPGSLQGLGESASAIPATGAGQVSVPLVLPPGPAPVVPDLTLRYDSRRGAGPLGVGWSIAIPQLQRRTDHGLPHYDSTDELLWNGQRLVEVAPGTYRLRVEGELTRLVALGSGYRADRPDGTKLYLGETPAAQVQSNGRVFRWLVDRVVDVHGDAAFYRYAQDGGQSYLSEIDYGRPGGPFAQVTFDYDPRADVLTTARAGWLVTTAWRLASIETRVDGAPVRRVSLGYAARPGLSCLARIEVCGSDGSTCLPPLSLTTTTVDPAAAKPVALASPGPALEDPDTALVDVDGDSLPDAVRLGPSGASVWRNLGPSGFGPEEPLPGAPAAKLSSPGAAFQDMDGVGRAGLLLALGIAGGGGFAYYPPTAGGLGAPMETPGPVGLSPNDPALRWLDLDGDGRVDALHAGLGAWTAWFNQGGGNLSAPVAVPRLTGLSFADRQLRLADMNDDGLVDLVEVHSGGVEVFYNLGFGAFAPPVAMAGAPDVSGDDARLALVDADGDGLPDLVYVAPGKVFFWRNQADGSFGPEVAVTDVPAYEPTATAVRFADLEGTGGHDVLLSGPDDAGKPRLVRIDLTSGVRPNLLAALDNGTGGRRAFTWRATGDLMAEAAAAGRPWRSAIPFPMEVVAEIDTDDGLSPTEIDGRAYRDPYYDGVQRRFRGFAESVERQPGDAHAAALEVDRRYHTGENEDESLAGRPVEESWREPNGPLYRRTIHRFVAQRSAVGLGGEVCAFPAEVERIDERWEGAGAPARFRIRQRFDGHGHPTVRWDDGRIDGPSADPEAGVWLFSYAEDEGRWILGLPAARELDAAAGRRISLERRYYDGAPFGGLALGEVERGDLVRRSRLVGGDAFADVERRRLDGWGNAVEILDAEGRRREVDFDPTRQLFPIGERRFPSPGNVLRFGAEFAPATGALVRFTDAGGQVTRFGDDALGRLVSIQAPDDPDGDPGELRSYRLDVFPPALVDGRRPEVGGPFSVQSAELYDGLLRPLAHVETAEGGQFAVGGYVARDARGDASVAYEPFFTQSLLGATPPAETPSAVSFFDALGRRIRRTLPAGGEERWAYGPAVVDHWDPVAATGAALPLRRRVDEKGRAIETERAGPSGALSVFRFERDPEGRVDGRVGPSGAQTSAAYDGLGNLVDLVDPDSGETRWTYDGSGHLLAKTDARGQTVRWSYDGAGRPVVETDPAGVRVRWQYDAPAPGGCGAPAPGRLISATDPTGSACFGYDVRGRLASEEIVQAGFDLATAFDFDGADRLSRIGYPDGTTLGFDYGGREFATAIPGLLAGATYDAAGRPLERAFANGLTVDVSRDAAGREVGVDAAAGGGPLVRIAWQLLDSGAPSGMTDARGTTGYGLDPQERLISEDGPDGRRLEGYDGEGRLTGRWSLPDDPRLPGTAPVFGRGAGPHALTEDRSGAYSYDAAGERTSGRGLLLGWDAEGRLATAHGPGFDAAYAYGFDGQRRSRKVTWADGHATAVLTFGPFVELRDGRLWKHVFLGTERIASLSGAILAAGASPAGGAHGCQTGPGDLQDLLLLLWLAGEAARRGGGRKLAGASPGRSVNGTSNDMEDACRPTAASPEPR